MTPLVSVLLLLLIGPGTEVAYDAGTRPQFDLPRRSRPERAIIIGTYDGLLVGVRKGDSPPYEGFELFDPVKDAAGERQFRIVTLRIGRLRSFTPNLEFRDEPPER